MGIQASASTMSAEKFKSRLKERGLSQIGFARMIGVNERTVRKWAAGEFPVPRYVEFILDIIGIIEGKK